MSRRRWIFGAAGCVLLLSAFTLAARPRISRTSIQLFAATCPCPTFHEEVTGLIVLNPLRNRAPENVATQFLSDLRNSKCEAPSAAWPGLCGYALAVLPVLDWKLRNRTDLANNVTLFYFLKGKGRPDMDINPEDAWGEGMVQVERVATEWTVTNYGARY